MPTIPLILSSEFGQNLSSDYSSFSQQFSPPISIPRDTAPRIRLYQASIPYVMPNVTTGVNDSLTVERKTGNTVHSTATLVLIKGCILWRIFRKESTSFVQTIRMMTSQSN